MPGTQPLPLPVHAAAYLVGNSLLLSMPSLAAAWPLSVLLALAAIRLPLQRWRLPAAMLLAGFVISALQVSLLLDRSLPLQMAGKIITVEGFIDGLPEADGRVVRFNLDVFRSDISGGKQIKGRIRVSDYRRDSIAAEPGQAWRLLLKLKPVHGFANQAGFDYEKWLFNQRIIGTAYIREKNAVQATTGANKNSPGILAMKRTNCRLPGLDRPATIAKLRLRLIQHIEEQLTASPFRGIVTALATGDRRGMDSQQWSVLQRTGTSHLMAISGLHVGLVAGIVFFLFRFLWRALPGLPLLLADYRAAAIAAFLAACFYSLLAGFSLPTQRALVMVFIFKLALLLGRRMRAVDILSLSLVLVLLFDPLAPLAAGFWLSFAAVAMILYIMLQRQYRPYWTAGAIARPVNLQWKLSLLMLPMTFLFFQQVSFVSPLANFIAIPLVALCIVPLVLLASLWFLVFGSSLPEQSLYQLADVLLHGLWYFLAALSNFAAGMPFTAGHTATTVAGLFFAALIFMLPAGLRVRRLSTLGLLVCFFPAQPAIDEGEFSMILLDVGQGLSAIIRTRQHALLFDSGARFSQKFNAGNAVVLPVLKSLSIARLDAMIVSHGDNDHRGGVDAVLEGIQTAKVISNEAIASDRLMPCRAGDAWYWDGVIFRILHPQANGLATGNNASCVLQVSSRYGSVLLPADIEEEAEREIIARHHAALRSRVLVAPHHGSNSSSTGNFLRAVDPDLVLFPAGWMNRYQHPAEKVVARLREHGIESRQTGECGALTVHAGKGGITVDSRRQTAGKLWDRSETDGRCSRKSL